MRSTEVVPLLQSDLLHGERLAGAVAEGLGETSCVHTVDDLRHRAERTFHAHLGCEVLDDLDRRRRDDVCVSAGFVMQVDQAARLAADVVEQTSEDVVSESFDVGEGDTLDGGQHLIAHPGRLFVRGPGEFEGDGARRILDELAPRHHAVAVGHPPQREDRGTADDRAIEIEERRAA